MDTVFPPLAPQEQQRRGQHHDAQQAQHTADQTERGPGHVPALDDPARADWNQAADRRLMAAVQRLAQTGREPARRLVSATKGE